ncbi:MAG: DEAD/DEAH box helicase family protein [Endomicrobia bacterium]|nr:DEAD/DEAH box helicase family protein [Endomicrobiia bacterium]
MQGTFDFLNNVTVTIEKPLYFRYEKTDAGLISQLAFIPGIWQFSSLQETESLYKLTHDNGISFIAKLKKKGDNTYKIDKVDRFVNTAKPFFDNVRINDTGLRPAQIGAVYSLLANWSLTKDVSSVVLPTGTGKTETMLVTTLADKANKTLVIVPSIDLKEQIASKFSTWGILRKLDVIPEDAANPVVFTLNETLANDNDIEYIKAADVVISTPALIAGASDNIKDQLKNIFSHVYFDEAHHVKAPTWASLKLLFKDSKIVQFTATPYRNDRKPIEGKIVYNYPLSQALEDKCFSKISLISIDEKHPKKKDFAIASAAIQKRNEDRKNGWTRHKIMVRAGTQTQSEELYEKYKEWFPDEKIVLVHSKTKGRREIVEQIKKDAYDIVICVDMLKEGFDYPDFKIAAVHGIHKSLSVLLQFIGRFTRTQEGLGDASFIVNYAEENISIELENLFQEGSGWEKVISEIADAKKEEAESLLSFLQNCQPYSGFDSPDIELNPKVVYPALSCVCFHAENVDWVKFSDSFNLSEYSLSQPFINTQENIFYFTTQRREKVKWAKTDKIKDQTWGLIAAYFDATSKILYVGYSEKNFDVKLFVKSITNREPDLINGDCVFRSFDSIKRLSIVHAGIFKPANYLHRYSKLSGADVTNELSKWKDGKRCKKSDFVGIGFRDGFPVSIGASVKGKIWSPARVGNLKEWKTWCINIGSLITDTDIDSNQLLENSAAKTELEKYPDDLVVLATDWSESLYDKIHKLTVERPSHQSFMLSECVLKTVHCKDKQADFILTIFDENIPLSLVLGGEKGYEITGLDDCKITIDGLKSSPIPIKQFFEENPPIMFLINGCTIAGCIHTNYDTTTISSIPTDRIEALEWKDVNYKTESLYKGSEKRENSIQEYIMQNLVNRGAKIVFNDDNAGETSDVIAIFSDEDTIYFEMIHCKFSSKDESGARISDLYEVAGQAVVSLRHKWRPEELLKHMERRNSFGVLANKRFFKGSKQDIEEIRKAFRYSDIHFEFAIAQPGVSVSKMSASMKNFLGSVYSTVVDMTETKLKCYFSE